MRRYHDFELRIFHAGEALEVDIITRPYSINLIKPIKIPLSNSHLITWKNLVTCNTQKEIAERGYSLYQQFFIKEVQSKFGEFLRGRSQDEGVRLGICTQTNDLGEAIWEILCNDFETQLRFLALNPRTPIVRTTRNVKEAYTHQVAFPLKLLVILASPRLVQRIYPAREKDSIEEQLKDLIKEGKLEIDYLGFDDPREANFDSLQKNLAKKQYDIVHMIGHGLLETGQEGIIALVNSEDCRQQDVPSSSLADFFCSRGVMVVILQSCQSGSVDSSVASFSGVAQQLLAAGVPAVLAMQAMIDQDVATYFIGKLYSAWLSTECKCSLEDALTQARQSVRLKYKDKEQAASWCIPVLYICSGVDFCIYETVDSNTSTVFKERKIDAALPQKTREGKETELIVLIRTPSRPGLRERLDANPQDFEARSEDVETSSEFVVSFPIDEKTKEELHTNVIIQVETHDFDLSPSERKVQIRPRGDDVLYRFFLTPKRKGLARLYINILDEKAETTSMDGDIWATFTRNTSIY